MNAANSRAHPAMRKALPVPQTGDRALLLCDGGSRGNPGPAAIAAVLVAADGRALDQRGGADRSRHRGGGRVPRDPARRWTRGRPRRRPDRGPQRLAARDRRARSEARRHRARGVVREVRAAAAASRGPLALASARRQRGRRRARAHLLWPSRDSRGRAATARR